MTIEGDFVLNPDIGEDPAFIQICNSATAVDSLSDFEDYFAPGALGVLHIEPEGVSVLPPGFLPLDCQPVVQPGQAAGLGGFFDKFASLFGVKPLVATSAVGPLKGGGGSFYSNSDFELAVLDIKKIYDLGATPPAPIDAALKDLGTVASGSQIPVAVQALAKCDLSGDESPFVPAGFCNTGSYDAPVALTWVHYFAQNGSSVSCDGGNNWGSACSMQTSNSEDASHGIAQALWAPANGESFLKAISCGSGVTGASIEIDGNLDEGSVQGPYGFCDRIPGAGSGAANGAGNGTTPFEGIIDNGTFYESGINDIELTWRAETCPAPDVTDGVRGDEWQVGTCAGEYTFTAKTTGGKTVPDNASLLWTNDGTNLYVAIEIRGASAKDLNDAFFYFDNDADANSGNAGDTYVHGIHAGDDVVVMRLGDPTKVTADHYAPLSCEGSPKASLCSAVDLLLSEGGSGDQTDGAAGVDGNNLFWEFSKELAGGSCPNGEDFCLGLALPDYVGIAGTITGGQGGSKGGTEVPGGDGYILIEIK
ncbi:MAG: hypothetical protein JSV95_07135 [Gemmatimonadota bacterium]|nr:MAG: hypothetical protein JSV95_07135 [Gemmatimonadota bacterium]